MSGPFCLQPLPHPSRRLAWEAIKSAPDGYVVQIKAPTRSLEQNAKLHAMIGEMVKAGVQWYGSAMDVEDWKNLFTAAIKRDQRVVPGMDGGFVILGLHTSQMTIREINEMIERVYAFGLSQTPPVEFKDQTEPEPTRRVA